MPVGGRTGMALRHDPIIGRHGWLRETTPRQIVPTSLLPYRTGKARERFRRSVDQPNATAPTKPAAESPIKAGNRPPGFVLAGHVPWAFSPRTGSVGIHVFERPKQGVDTRIKSAQDDL
jgi:hypothetical protein